MSETESVSKVIGNTVCDKKQSPKNERKKRIKYRNCMLTLYPIEYECKEERKKNYHKTWESINAKLVACNVIKFCCGQFELCPETERKHLQLYIEFHNEESLKSIRNYFEDIPEYRIWDYLKNGKKGNLQERLGTQQQAIDYVTKEETRLKNTEPFYRGKKKLAGHRSDLDSMVDMIEDGFTKKEILLEHRGNGLRHISMICKAVDIMWDCDAVDSMIRGDRWAKKQEELEKMDDKQKNIEKYNIVNEKKEI